MRVYNKSIMQHNQMKYNRFSSSSSSTSKSVVNKKPLELLSPISFPPLSGPSQTSDNLNISSNSYLNKVRKVVTPVNKEIILPGFVKIQLNKNHLNQLVYTYGSENTSIINSNTHVNLDEIDAYAAFNTLNELHEKRKLLYTNMWGTDACEKEFPPHYSYESDSNTDSSEKLYDSSDEF